MQPRGTSHVRNFGGNIRFRPRNQYLPRDEEDVLRILDEHRTGTIRVIGAGHSWNGGIETSGALVDLRHFRRIQIHPDRRRVSVGAGCRIAELLAHLARRGLTLPSIGLIARQTVAGATATGTHGSGRHSMSHYVESMRIACYGKGGEAEVRRVDSGEALRAVRCSVGALGVVLEVTLKCVPQYYVRERCVWRSDLDAVLDNETAAPLQQFYLIPHTWAYLEHERSVAPDNRRSGIAVLYRAYWLIVIDVLLHLGIKVTASLLRSRRLVDLIYRRLLPVCIFPKWRVTDRSYRQLLMRHDLFRHLEMEAFVPREKLRPALAVVSDILRAADNADYEVSAGVHDRIRSLDLEDALENIRGSYSHHYPICVRRVRPDDTLISMSSCHGVERRDWYAISLITFTEPRLPFQNVARFLATTMVRTLGARLHWGKWDPLDARQIEDSYPGIAAFRAICARFDPQGVFRNQFLEEALFGTSAHQ